MKAPRQIKNLMALNEPDLQPLAKIDQSKTVIAPVTKSHDAALSGSAAAGRYRLTNLKVQAIQDR
jgi:hypothetical protein